MEPCELSPIFRHKDALGWFIALLKVCLGRKKHVAIQDMLENLEYIYDILGKNKAIII